MEKNFYWHAARTPLRITNVVLISRKYTEVMLEHISYWLQKLVHKRRTESKESTVRVEQNMCVVQIHTRVILCPTCAVDLHSELLEKI